MSLLLICSLVVSWAWQPNAPLRLRRGLAPRASFLEDALGEDSSEAADRQKRTKKSLASPLAGVSISAEGFTVLLSNGTSVLPVVLHPADVEAVVSAEGLTLLQLLQGIDMATTVLPPGELDRAFGKEGVELAEVRVLRRRRRRRGGSSEEEKEEAPPPSVADRGAVFEAAVRESAPKLKAVLASKLGVSVSEATAGALLAEFADDKAQLPDRATFTSLLERARALNSRVTNSPAAVFDLVSSDNTLATEIPPFTALALALRHKAPLWLEPMLFEEAENPRARLADEAFFRDYPSLLRAEDLSINAVMLEAHFASMYDTATKALAASGKKKEAGPEDSEEDSEQAP